MLQDVNATAIGDLVAAVELFNEVNGTNYDGIMLPTEVVTFRSTQAKNTDNLNPTADDDIRFSMKLPVEETADLIAWHNISSSAIDEAIELGGLAMPSFAVKPADSVHSSYGDISVIARKDSIDPQRNRSSRIFAGDAWTPVFPEVRYKINSVEAEKIADKVYELIDKAGAKRTDFSYGLAIDEDNMDDAINRRGSFVNAYRDSYGMKLAFIEDTGRKISIPKREKVYTNYADISTLKKIAKEISFDKLSAFGGYEDEMQYEPRF